MAFGSFSRSAKWEGPSLTKILKTLDKSNLLIVKSGIRSAALLVRKEAKEIAETFKVSGDYKKAIKFRIKASIRRKEVVARIGIMKGDKVMKYARKVENRHKVYTRLEKTQKTPVRNEFKIGINKYLDKLKIK